MLKVVSGKVLAGGIAAALLIPTIASASTGSAEIEPSEEYANTHVQMDEETEVKTKFNEIFEKIQSGELTKEDAQEKFQELKRHKFHKVGPHKHPHFIKLDEDTKEQLKEIRNKVKAGELTREEARVQMEELGLELPSSPFEDLDEDTKEQLKEIRNKVKAGELTKEEARVQMEELGLELPSSPFEDLDEDTKEQLKEIRNKVKAGELTKEEAREQMEALGFELVMKDRYGHIGKRFGLERNDDSLNQDEDASDL